MPKSLLGTVVLFEHRNDTPTHRVRKVIWNLTCAESEVDCKPRSMKWQEEFGGRKLWKDRREKKEGYSRAVTFHRCLSSSSGCAALRRGLLFSCCTLPQHNNQCAFLRGKQRPFHFWSFCFTVNISHLWAVQYMVICHCSSLLLQSGACKHVLTGHVLQQWQDMLA